MLVTVGMWIVGIGIVALSLECVVAAFALFGCGALMIRFSS